MSKAAKGRGSGFNPPNRFEKLHLEPLDIEIPSEPADRVVPTRFYNDTSKTILAKNESPDIPFTYSVNPYRGCEHGCIYCYARPSHEYLGFSAGLDFETKILVKMDAAELLEGSLRKKSWVPQMVAVSGNTDPYQPIERKLQLTRKCLEVFHAFGNPVSITTKNALILRDSDMLQKMATLNLVHVMLSITTLRTELARKMEPRTSAPAIRLETIEALARKGIPVGVIVAPIIPGLTDEEIPSILRAASDHGATVATCILLKLPGAVQPLFLDWLERELPERAGKITGRLRETRQGKLNDSRFGTRMTGEGEIAQSIAALFELTARRLHLDTRWADLSVSHFKRGAENQMEIF